MTENNKNYSGKAIGKWERNDDQSKKQQMRAKYLQNQEKRKQLAIDNLKRRKQVQKRRHEQFQAKKKAQEGQLKMRKQSQEEAYLKYLKRDSVQNGMNLYDRVQAEKKSKKQQVTEVRSTRKWGDPTTSSRSKSKQKQHEQQKQKQETADDNIIGLDLDVHVTKDMEKIKKFYQEGKEKLKLLQDFQKQWEESKDMIESSLLDSLDLDKDSIMNSKAMAKESKKPLFESFEKMKESFLSQSLELSQGDIELSAESIQVNNKKHPKVEEIKQQIKEQIPIKLKQAPVNKFNQELKDLIGYDSLDESSAIWHMDAFKKKQPEIILKLEEVKPRKQNEFRESQIQNQHKKVQLFNWASKIEQVQESGVSSNVSRKPRNHILQNLNQKIKSQKANIVQQEQRLKALKEQDKKKSLQQRRQAQKRYSELSLQRARKNKSTDKSSEKSRKLSNQKLPPINSNNNMKGSKYSNITAPSFTSKISKQSRMTAPVPNVPRQSSKSHKNQYFENPQTIYSEDHNQDIQQFIRDDLLDLNQRERNLQKQIKNLHFANRNKIKSIQQKQQIQTNYKNTDQLIRNQPSTNKELKSAFECVSQDQLQDSLYRLDQLLKKQDRKLQFLKNMPIEEERKQSEDSLRMSDSLQSQVPTSYKQKVYSKSDPNQELLTQIIKLAARNIGENDDSIDLDRLKEQLSKLTNKKQSEKHNSNNQSYSKNKGGNSVQKIQAKQQQKQTKPNFKKDHKQLSYAEIMKIKNASTNEPKAKPTKQKSENLNKTPRQTIQPNPPSYPSNQTEEVEQQEVTDKISVNERLRRLLLQ